MKLKLACADFAFPLLTHEQSLRLISMLGFGGVDIGLFDGRSHLWPSREFENVGRSAAALKRSHGFARPARGGRVSANGPRFQAVRDQPPRKRDRRQLARDWFSKTLEYAVACGCEHVTVLPGVHFEEERAEESFARAVDELTWRTERAKTCGVTLGTEAHVGSLAPDPATAQRLAQSVPGLTLTLDYTHFTRAGMPDDAIEPLLAHASHFHVRGAGRAACRRLSRTTSSTTAAWSTVFKKPDTPDGSASNTCGSIGSTAMSAIICRRQFCFGTF